MKSPIFSLIIAGGEGKRLVPLSTPDCPKQFISLPDGSTLLEQTVKRAKLIADKTCIITQEKYSSLTHQHAVGVDHIITEPFAKNTGPAILLGACLLQKLNSDAFVVILPSDHYISNECAYARTVNQALVYASESSKMVLIGTRPTHACVEYGYMYVNEVHHKIVAFEEKPDLQRAQVLSNQQNCWWNCGMIISRIEVVISQARRVAPDIMHLIEEYVAGNTSAYSALSSISFDKAVLEKLDDLLFVPAQFEWSDVGTLEQFLAVYGLAHYQQRFL